MRLAMMIDLPRCIGCMACVSACKEQWDTGPGAARTWVHTFEHGRRGQDLGITFYPGLCMQCAKPPCTEGCPTGATFANDQGIVLVDPDVCIGCGNCVPLCAYGARHVDPVKRIVEKCNLCAPFVARGEPPACASSCLAECRVFGDLDDPTSEIAGQIGATGAKPLVTGQITCEPKITYAGDADRAVLLTSGVVREPRPTTLTRAWTSVGRPFARYVVPGLAGLALAAGGVVNVVTARRERLQREQAAAAKATTGTGPAPGASGTAAPERLPRHPAGIRFLHWFNLLSWILLLGTGVALMATKGFALFGQGFPRLVAGWFGGAARLLRFHALWGILWALVVVPLFLLYERGGRKALAELRLTRDDLRWLARKPSVALGLRQVPLPPQGKYNAGQKLFAMLVLLGTATIIATGMVMTFHLGSPAAVRAAILIHKLAIGCTLIGVAVHFTMAAILKEERPALRSMIDGYVDRKHAEEHSSLWVKELDDAERGPHA